MKRIRARLSGKNKNEEKIVQLWECLDWLINYFLKIVIDQKKQKLLSANFFLRPLDNPRIIKKIHPKITRSTVDTQVGLNKAGIGLKTLKFKVFEMNELGGVQYFTADLIESVHLIGTFLVMSLFTLCCLML